MNSDPPSTQRTWMRAALGLLLLLALAASAGQWAHGHQLLSTQGHLTLGAWLAPLGWAAPFAFVGIKVGGIAVGLPSSPITLAGGALFGFPAGLLLNVGGGTLGSILPFAYARWWGREAIALRLKGRMSEWDAHLGERGFWAILFVRLVPVLPFTLINYAAGLSQVRFRDYLAATLIGMIPGSGAITFLGASAAGGSVKGVMMALGLLCALAVLPMLLPARLRKARQAQPHADAEATPST